MDNFDARLAADKRAKAAEAEAAKLRARIVELEARVQSDDDPKDKPPGVPAEDDDSDDIDPKTGKRRIKKKAEDQACDKPRTEDDEEATSKARALMIVNCHRRSLGQAPIAKLIQDGSAIPVNYVSPQDSEAFAKCVIGAWRKATGRPPLAANEWVSIRKLRGEA